MCGMLHRGSSITLLSVVEREMGVGRPSRGWEQSKKEGGAYGGIMWSCCRERQNVTMALLSYMSFWPDIFHSLGSIGGWSWSELIGGESSGGIMGGCRYAANSASVSSP